MMSRVSSLCLVATAASLLFLGVSLPVADAQMVKGKSNNCSLDTCLPPRICEAGECNRKWMNCSAPIIEKQCKPYEYCVVFGEQYSCEKYSCELHHDCEQVGDETNPMCCLIDNATRKLACLPCLVTVGDNGSHLRAFTGDW